MAYGACRQLLYLYQFYYRVTYPQFGLYHLHGALCALRLPTPDLEGARTLAYTDMSRTRVHLLVVRLHLVPSFRSRHESVLLNVRILGTAYRSKAARILTITHGGGHRLTMQARQTEQMAATVTAMQQVQGSAHEVRGAARTQTQAIASVGNAAAEASRPAAIEDRTDVAGAATKGAAIEDRTDVVVAETSAAEESVALPVEEPAKTAVAEVAGVETASGLGVASKCARAGASRGRRRGGAHGKARAAAGPPVAGAAGTVEAEAVEAGTTEAGTEAAGTAVAGTLAGTVAVAGVAQAGAVGTTTSTENGEAAHAWCATGTGPATATSGPFGRSTLAFLDGGALPECEERSECEAPSESEQRALWLGSRRSDLLVELAKIDAELAEIALARMQEPAHSAQGLLGGAPAAPAVCSAAAAGHEVVACSEATASDPCLPPPPCVLARAVITEPAAVEPCVTTPCVVKPTTTMGGRGLFVSDTTVPTGAAGAARAIAHARTCMRTCMRTDRWAGAARGGSTYLLTYLLTY